MRQIWNTNRQPKVLLVDMYSDQPRDVVISVYDWKKKDTIYSKQSATVNGNDQFEISLPVTPDKAFFEITPAVGGLLGGLPKGLTVSLREEKYEPRWSCAYNKDPQLQDFLRFASWFSEHAGILSSAYGKEPASIYQSVSGKFRIRYVPEIIEDEKYFNVNGQKVLNPLYGQPSPTSLRVHSISKEIEAAQKYVKTYTFPQRMALLVHEYAHEYINVNPDDEQEADRNSILILRCLGFSKREIGTAFTTVFKRWDSDENAARALAVVSLLKSLP